MHILFTGPLTPGSITSARVESLRELNHTITLLDQRPFFRSNLWQKLQARILFGPSLHAYERALVQVSRQAQPDLIFIDCALYLRPQTVQALAAPHRLVVQYSSDYFGYNSHIYRKLRRAAPLYDAHIITNGYNHEYLRRWNARHTLMTRFGYDPALHFPVPVTPAQQARFGADVAFGGHCEPFYVEMLRALKRAGFSLRVSGKAWLDADFLSPEEKVGHVTPEEYRSMVCAARVAPAFLSKWNRNTCGMRIFEVAAMGAALIAERTDEQLGYFRDGVEAEFFSGTEELVSKTRRHLQNDDRRKAMGEAGRIRCTTSGYSYKDRMRELIADLSALRPAEPGSEKGAA